MRGIITNKERDYEKIHFFFKWGDGWSKTRKFTNLDKE